MAGLLQKLLGHSQVVLLKSSPALTITKTLPSLQTIDTVGPCLAVQVRSKRTNPKPKLRFPFWYLKKERVKYNENITRDNSEFIKEVIHDSFGPPAVISGIPTFELKSPLKSEPVPRGEWSEGTKRCGLITRKIGIYPMWKKDGKIIFCTLLQVVDNHVVKYIPPEEYTPARQPERFLRPNKFGCLLVGAECVDPQLYTKEYCGLFSEAGLPPKRVLGRFKISPNAVIQPGTPLYATHFQPGDVVDVLGVTIDRGFQGVMKRWGFKGMPASHGQTKTHRKGGNVGGGGEKARIWPGTKMPGQMGNRHRVHRGLRIWRINTKYNVLYVQGHGVPGETNSIVYVYDTMLPLRKRKGPPQHFPTFYPESGTDLPEDLFDEEVHQFSTPSITFQEAVKK